MHLMPRGMAARLGLGQLPLVGHIAPESSALSTLLLATVVVLPTVPMAVVACLHLVAMNLKARHEERHLQETFGMSYVEYCQRAGRFWPRKQFLKTPGTVHVSIGMPIASTGKTGEALMSEVEQWIESVVRPPSRAA